MTLWQVIYYIYILLFLHNDSYIYIKPVVLNCSFDAVFKCEDCSAYLLVLLNFYFTLPVIYSRVFIGVFISVIIESLHSYKNCYWNPFSEN